jgi:predicted transcriptional regulator
MADTIQQGSRRNFFIVDNCIFDERLNLEPLDMLVYICLLRYANNRSKEAFPGQETIAKNVGISRKRVNIAVKVLEEKGLIKKQQRFDKTGGQKSNNYIVYDASEVIHRVCPEDTGGVSESYRGCEPGLQEGVSQGYTNNTYLKIHKEKEPQHTDEEDLKQNSKIMIRQLKELALATGKNNDNQNK